MMAASIGSLSDAAVPIVLVAMFAMVLIVARNAFKEMPLFGDGGSWVLAFCTAALSVLGLVRFLGPPDGNTRTEGTPVGRGGGIGSILLPYAALAISILFVLLLLAIAKRCPRDHTTSCEQQCAGPAPKVKKLKKKRQIAPRSSLQISRSKGARA